MLVNGRFFAAFAIQLLFKPSAQTAVEYFLIFSCWFNTAWIMDTVDHLFVVNQTKLDTEMIEADLLFVHPVLVLNTQCGGL